MSDIQKIMLNKIHEAALKKLKTHANMDQQHAEMLAGNIASEAVEQIIFEARKASQEVEADDDEGNVFQDDKGKRVVSPVFRRVPG